MSDTTKPFEVWCEEGGRRVRVEPTDRGGFRFTILDILAGWPGEVVAQFTLTDYRTRDLALYLQTAVHEAKP